MTYCRIALNPKRKHHAWAPHLFWTPKLRFTMAQNTFNERLKVRIMITLSLQYFLPVPQHWFLRLCTKINVISRALQVRFQAHYHVKFVLLLRASQNGIAWLALIFLMESQLTYTLDHFYERQKMCFLDYALKSRLIVFTSALKFD